MLTQKADLTLYSRPDCHLCDDAARLLHEVLGETCWSARNVEDQVDWLRRYGRRVPVLRRNGDGAELEWPFDRQRLEVFVS